MRHFNLWDTRFTPTPSGRMVVMAEVLTTDRIPLRRALTNAIHAELYIVTDPVRRLPVVPDSLSLGRDVLRMTLDPSAPLDGLSRRPGALKNGWRLLLENL